jgi:hypothetical protein
MAMETSPPNNDIGSCRLLTVSDQACLAGFQKVFCCWSWFSPIMAVKNPPKSPFEKGDFSTPSTHIYFHSAWYEDMA